MRYLALLYDTEGPEAEPGSPEWDADVARYAAFEAHAGPHIAGGEALQPSRDGVVVRPGGGTLVLTDGPFAETAEVVGGYFVFEAGDLDAALDLALRLPTLRTGAVEVRPMVEHLQTGAAAPAGSTRWLALLHGVPTDADRPGTPAWDAAVEAHARFGQETGSHVLGGGALHPPETASTLRRRGDEVVVTDGPFSEAAEVVGGYYELWAGDRDEAVAIAARIPVGDGVIELRPIVDWDE